MKKLIPLALFALLGACASVEVDPARLSQHVRTLSSDAFEGRGPATPGEDKTVAYLASQFQAAGVEPGGDIGPGGVRGWTQDVPLARFEMKGLPLTTVRVGGETVALRQGDDISIRAAQTNVDEVVLRNAQLVFLGYGVRAPERNWDDFKGQDLSGKVGIVLINDPDFETGVGDFGGRAMTWYGRWPYKYAEAAQQGLEGLLIVHETAPASYGWATVRNSNVNAQFDIVRKDPGEVHPPLEAWITREVAVDLLARAGQDFEALKRAARSRDFQPVHLDATFSTRFGVAHSVIVSKNVVAKLTGTKRPDEYVIHSAHWDHLGVGLPDANGDVIYNGAIDNATGTAALLELARVYAAEGPADRSVVFLALAAEEKGLLGSEYYADNPLYPLETTVGVLNTDGLAPTGPANDFSITGLAELGLKDDLIAVAARHGLTYSPDPRPEAGLFYRSDHFPFAKRGVPAISYKPGQDLVVGGLAAGQAWANHYTADLYHQPADEWSPGWDFTGIVQGVTLMHELGQELAESDRWPEWGATSEFKPIRDASAAARR